MTRLKALLPILDWLPRYTRKDLSGDLSAGITVGVMLIPQGMAYAMLAGLPPIYGLYGAVVPLLVYTLFGTARQLAVGPGAMVSLLVGTGLAKVAHADTESYLYLALLLSLLVGVIQLLLGVFRLGFIVHFLSRPVISGFTSAAALMIALNQLKHLFGTDIAKKDHFFGLLLASGQSLNQIHLLSFAIGLIGILLIVGFKKYLKKWPGLLLVVMAGVLVVYIFKLDHFGVKILGDIPAGIAAPSAVAIDWAMAEILWPTALAIALYSFIEASAVSSATHSKNLDYVVRPNQELVAMGLANVIGSFFKCFPITGGLSRTAVNVQAGARTSLALVFSAALMALTLWFFTPVFYYMPQAVLASVIMVSVYSLIDFKAVRHLWQTDRKDLAMLLLTFLSTLIIGIQEGILIGVLLSLGMIIYKSSYPHYAFLGQIPGTDIFRNLKRYPEAQALAGVIIIRFDAQLFFANVGQFKQALDAEMRQRPDATVVVVSAEAINSIDSTAMDVLCELVDDLEHKGIEIVFTGMKGPVRDIIIRSGLFKRIGHHHFFANNNEVLTYLSSEHQSLSKVRFQSNVAEE